MNRSNSYEDPHSTGPASLVAGLLVVALIAAGCSSSRATQASSTTLATTTSVAVTDTAQPTTTEKQNTGGGVSTAPTVPPTTSTGSTPPTDVKTSTTVSAPIGKIQAILDSSLGPDGIKFVDAGVTSPPTGAILTIRVPGQSDLVFTSGANDNGSQVTADEPFLISRISRTLVETAAWLLVDNGTLDPTATLAKWLPNYPNAGAITVDMLLNETAGMADFTTHVNDMSLTEPSRRWTLKEVLDVAATDPPLAPPGTFAQVPADSESIALAYVLEQVTAQPIGQLVKTLVTQPLHLHDTGFAEDPTAPTNIQSGAFVLNGKAVQTSGFNPTAYYTVGAPSWGAYSTAPDLMTLIAALSNGTLLGKARTPSPAAFTDDRAAVGKVLYIANGDPLTGYCPCQNTPDGHTPTAYGRRGSETGTTIAVYYFPTTGNTMVLHYNASPATTSDLEDLLYKVEDLLTTAG